MTRLAEWHAAPGLMLFVALVIVAIGIERAARYLYPDWRGQSLYVINGECRPLKRPHVALMFVRPVGQGHEIVAFERSYKWQDAHNSER